LTWHHSDDGGSAITSYKVYRRVNGRSHGQIATLGSVTSYDDLTLEPGIDYVL
jgi:hypothetical protein